MHLGSQRQDKFPAHLGPLIDELAKRGYQLVRVDELLGRDTPVATVARRWSGIAGGLRATLW